jgi:hypothetical protein
VSHVWGEERCNRVFGGNMKAKDHPVDLDRVGRILKWTFKK